MEKEFTPEDIATIESVRRAHAAVSGAEISFERAAELLRFTDLLIQIASGKFRCQKCGDEQQIYVFNRK